MMSWMETIKVKATLTSPVGKACVGETAASTRTLQGNHIIKGTRVQTLSDIKKTHILYCHSDLEVQPLSAFVQVILSEPK